MLMRKKDWFSVFNLPASDHDAAAAMARALEVSAGMMHKTDIESLAALLAWRKPKRVFEIGTYKGASSDLFLTLLPQAQVISIAFVQDLGLGGRYNNDDLPPDQVGALVSPENRPRFTQLIGDSHAINPADFIRTHGRMDLVFIDGDHSREGVGQDTDLAHAILAPGGAIAWHDANPKRKYLGSRLFLEEDMPQLALATEDDYIGGVACWTAALERQLRGASKPTTAARKPKVTTRP